MDSPKIADLIPGVVVTGPLLPEPVEILTVVPTGAMVKVVGMGLETGQVYRPVLDEAQVAQLSLTPKEAPFDGDAVRFRLGIEARRLGLAYEYDPYFSLSIARIDPLPHQLEAVYDYFLSLPRIRFLLADDPGAGKTIMAGLLLKELKVRGLIQRVLIVTPANLTFQWQREMRDKFRETFQVIRGDVLRSGYGQNPWEDHAQAITSISWISHIADAKESLLKSRWDLVIVDEAHKMSPTRADSPTQAFKVGQELSGRTDHYLLMTATPHKGDPEHFRRFLTLLDRDVYADIKSLQVAMDRKSAPFYLRRVKEAMVTFPNPDTGKPEKLYKNRFVDTVAFDLDPEEDDFYGSLTEYVQNQSAKAAAEDSPAARALGFTMAMLQRRFASSVYAVRRSLERMKERRERILADPEKFKQQLVEKKKPDDFDDLTDEEQQKILTDLENVVATLDPAALRVEIQDLSGLIDEARHLEQREVESKLTKLKKVLQDEGIFGDPKTKLLIFTEHKDTLDYLAGDGKDKRPKGKLLEWGLNVTQIHGGMKIGDRNTPNTRIYAEKEFREDCQVLVATEAAGEGINLQFCWLMINYDIPWNPVRLEQRMGRIHRYGQEHDCYIFNFAAVNTVEGRVLRKLLERLAKIKDDLKDDKVFDVVGEVFPANLLEKSFRDLYAGKTRVKDIEDRIDEELDPERFRKITQATLEGLAKRDLNLNALIGKRAEAKERRLVPEVIEDFFQTAAPISGIPLRAEKAHEHFFRVGRIPKSLKGKATDIERRFGTLGDHYSRIVFNKEYLKQDATLEWVTPGHPLFEVVRTDIDQRTADDLRRGAVFLDVNTTEPYRLDVYAASIKDGRGSTLHRRLYVVRSGTDGMSVRQPTVFLDLVPAGQGARPPSVDGLPEQVDVERMLIEQALQPELSETKDQRQHEMDVVEKHVKLSLDTLINREMMKLGEMQERLATADAASGLQGFIRNAEIHLEELNERRDSRLDELSKERECSIADMTFVGRAWVVPHPERDAPDIAPMVRDDEIERIAVEVAKKHERDNGWDVQSVELENRGYDLRSRKAHPEDPGTYTQVRFIEVKGRARGGEVGLSSNEYKTAVRLGDDYWLYVVYDCASDSPQLHLIQNPAKLGWKPVVRVEHYHATQAEILSAAKTPE